MSNPAALNILITAGPTREAIDPVRFISNRSTGVMGFAIARIAHRRGHKVILISGPTQEMPPKDVNLFRVETARQMYQKVIKNFKFADVVIMAAAVSDYRPANVSRQKIKKDKRLLNLKLIRNIDILKTLGERKKDQILVGFALQTENLYENAVKKLKDKNLDIIVANRLGTRQDIFGRNKTSILILDRQGSKRYFHSLDKEIAAKEIIKRVEDFNRSRFFFWRRTQVA